MEPALSPTATKPRLRGVSHVFATVAALAGAAYLIAIAPPGVGAPVLVYAAGLVALFGVSALYHKPMWSPKARAFLRRLDHATIFVFIAASYTPICALALPTKTGHLLLLSAWGFASLGLLRAILWPEAPRLVTALLYVAMGWLIVGGFSALVEAMTPLGVSLLAAGGIVYTLGAVLYALKWPEPVPGVFGHHEVFHLLVIGAAVCHFAVIREVVLGAG